MIFRDSHLHLIHNIKGIRARGMVINATYNNVSDISWRSVLFVVETGVPGENQ
jgi:hypothetical protein